MAYRLSQEQKDREIQEGRWERYTLWYRKIPKRDAQRHSDQRTSKKTFYYRAQIDEFLSDHPAYEAARIDKTVQEIVWTED